jgi:steroid delta-isomerase-like uncharacterized protein
MKSPPASIILAANTALITRGDLAAVAEFFAPGYIALATAAKITGHGGIRRFLREIRRAFPDLKIEVEILVAGKDRIAWQRTWRATHRTAYKGFPATGRRIVWRDMVVSRVQDGRIAEEWVITDLAERLLRARKR